MFGFGIAELFILLCILAPLVLWVIALVDIIKSDFVGNNKLIWLLLVLLIPLLGVILYFFIGRNQKEALGFVDDKSGNGKKFCNTCGEELNVRAEICPKCGVRQPMPKKSGSNPLLVVVVLIVIGVGSVAVIGILAAIAIPQFSSYRVKSYNSAALGDLRNTKTRMEAYAADHGRYPESLEQARADIPSVGVSVAYEKTGKESYVITAVHEKGDRIYLGSSVDAEVKWRNKDDENGQFLPL